MPLQKTLCLWLLNSRPRPTGGGANITGVNRNRQLAAIAIGGAAGAVLRIACVEAWPTGSGIPWSTLAVNLAGALVLGFAAELTLADNPASAWRLPLVGTGFCGAFTTFSGICFETLDLIDRGSMGTALLYLAASVILGLGAARLGVAIADTRMRSRA